MTIEIRRGRYSTGRERQRYMWRCQGTKNNFEIDTESQSDMLQVMEQEDPVLRDDGKLTTLDEKYHGPQGKRRQTDAGANSKPLLRQPNYSATALHWDAKVDTLKSIFLPSPVLSMWSVVMCMCMTRGVTVIISHSTRRPTKRLHQCLASEAPCYLPCAVFVTECHAAKLWLHHVYCHHL